jgi:hypothetical protein
VLQQVFDATDVANFIDPDAAVCKQFFNRNLLSKDKLDDYNMIVDLDAKASPYLTREKKVKQQRKLMKGKKRHAYFTPFFNLILKLCSRRHNMKSVEGKARAARSAAVLDTLMSKAETRIGLVGQRAPIKRTARASDGCTVDPHLSRGFSANKRAKRHQGGRKQSNSTKQIRNMKKFVRSMQRNKKRDVDREVAREVASATKHMVHIPPTLRNKRKPKGKTGNRWKSQIKVMINNTRRVGKVSCDNVGPMLCEITKYISSTPFERDWPGKNTILRDEVLLDMVELILQSKVAQNAIAICMHWDLSPQGNKEYMATYVSFALPTDTDPNGIDLGLAELEAQCIIVSEHVQVIKYCLPLVQCAGKDAIEVQMQLKKLCSVSGIDANKVQWVVTDGGSENAPAARATFPNHVAVYCAAHALNLVLEEACEVFDGKEQKATKMSQRCLNKLDSVINLLRRHWPAMQVYIKDETHFGGVVGDDITKPKRAQKIRWLSAIFSLMWLLPLRKTLCEIILKHFILDPNARVTKTRAGSIKVNKSWLQAYQVSAAQR